MEKLKYIKIEHKDGTLSENVPIGVDVNNVDNGNETLDTILNRFAINDVNHTNGIATLRSQVLGLASGSPLVANTMSDMTNTSKIYVLTTNGH